MFIQKFDTANIVVLKMQIPSELSACHHLIYSMLKTTFEREESKPFTYRNYKEFLWETFEKDLTNGENENYEQNFIKVLNIHAPKRLKSNLRKKRSRLKNKASRSKDPVYIANNKK